MGGMSFKCPHCDFWRLTKQALKDHLKDKHRIINVQILGTGPVTYLEPVKSVGYEGDKN